MLKTVLIGCGRISPMHLASISMLENSELVAVCDVKEERAVNAAEQYNCSYYTDYKKMLLEKKPDVVHICTPHYLHHSMACFAAEQGIHVVLEKPMAINYDDAVDMVHCCEKNHVTISIMFQNRYNRAVRLIKEELEKETRYLKQLNETSEQLRKKEAELNHAHKLKIVGTLAGGIAHDINNLLTPILGYSELLLMQLPEGGEYQEEVQEIYKASQKGKELVEQLLSFSRKDSSIIKVEPTDIKAVIKDALKLLEAVKSKGIIIKEAIEENCGYVNANFAQLHQVILNLCTNAYQSIGDKKGVIEIALNTISGEEASRETTKHLSDESYAKITISDTGCGMSEETLSRIFEPFFTTKTIKEGTGLGLFVVQSIIEKYGGAITVDSKEGFGSTFKVYLPLTDNRTEEDNKELSGDNACSRKRILVVDDNKDILKVLKKGLSHVGYDVEVETDSLKAVERFNKSPEAFDVVITDFIMPNLKGDELADAIKAIRKDISIILITGYTDGNIEVIEKNDAIDEYLSKPIELNELYKVISRLLSR